MFFIIALVFTFIIKIRFPKEVSIATFILPIIIYLFIFILIEIGSYQLLNVNTVCRRVLEEDEKVKEDPQVKEVREKCRPLFQLLSQQLGEKIDTIVQVDYAYDYFYIHVSTS